ncbi:MAG TPA: ATP-binding protein [Gemmatimonadaceae bacterium]|nr:ATP-binding protein [Gemmatimonadaceae bacterium]
MTEPLPSREDIDRLTGLVDLSRERAERRYDRDRLTGEESHQRLLAAYEELSVAEEELRSQHEAILDAHRQIDVERNRYKTLFEFAPDPCVVTDKLGTIEQANSAAAEFLGVPAALLVGKPMVSFVDLRTRPEFRGHLRGLDSALRSDRMLIDLTVRDGRTVPVEATVATIPSRHDAAEYCWLLRDMSKQRDSDESMAALNRALNARVAQRTRELEIALAGEQAARKEAEAANRIKSELFARLSHEFRTPLHAVSGYLEILQQNIHGALNDDQRKDVDRIHQAQEHLMALVNMILDFAKLEGGLVELAMAEIPIEETLRAAESLVTPQFAKKGVAYSHRGGDPSHTVFADREKVQQIIVNLLANAVKFTPAGGSVDLEWKVEEDHLIVRVRDTGSGVPEEKIEEIFEPFVQVRAPGSMPSGGTGLGLAISRDLARAMGGDVRATSRLGVGSVFTVTLPLRKHTTTKLSAPTAQN